MMNDDTIAFNGTVLYVGDFKFRNVAPGHYHGEERETDSDTYRTRSVRMFFDNGWMLSIIWGTMTYSSNRWSDEISRKYGPPYAEFTEEPTEVEIAAMSPDDGRLIEWADGDGVQGHVDAEELLKLIAYMAKWPTHIGIKPHLRWRKNPDG